MKRVCHQFWSLQLWVCFQHCNLLFQLVEGAFRGFQTKEEAFSLQTLPSFPSSWQGLFLWNLERGKQWSLPMSPRSHQRKLLQEDHWDTIHCASQHIYIRRIFLWVRMKRERRTKNVDSNLKMLFAWAITFSPTKSTGIDPLGNFPSCFCFANSDTSRRTSSNWNPPAIAANLIGDALPFFFCREIEIKQSYLEYFLSFFQFLTHLHHWNKPVCLSFVLFFSFFFFLFFF